ncbi:transposase [Rickettsia endosymbiont of Oedothorax gibbosus]|uniref:transposase n=1 Tax=Rickettsia endosymbiont of Oedothorax gibbosus TaxID=931099 RepID=UPI0020240B9F|nr:transposase [Rickettsia endosymbiont of Oedothorax gibbosus]
MAKKLDTDKDTLNISNQLVEELLSKADPSELFGRDGLFQQLKKQIVEKILASELDHELGYSKHSKMPKVDNNRRNGSYEKTVIDGDGRKLTVEVPRDREGEYNPIAIIFYLNFQKNIYLNNKTTFLLNKFMANFK